MALCGKCATVDVTTPSFLFFPVPQKIISWHVKSFRERPVRSPRSNNNGHWHKDIFGGFFPAHFPFQNRALFCVIWPIGREMRNFLKNSCQSSRYSWVDSEPQKILSTWNNFHFSKKWNSALVPTFYFASETVYVVVYSFKDEIWS